MYIKILNFTVFLSAMFLIYVSSLGLSCFDSLTCVSGPEEQIGLIISIILFLVSVFYFFIGKFKNANLKVFIQKTTFVVWFLFGILLALTYLGSMTYLDEIVIPLFGIILVISSLFLLLRRI